MIHPYFLLCTKYNPHAVAVKVAEELTAKDVIKAHARDELGIDLGIDLDDLINPLQASLVSMISFVVGAGLPLLSSAIITNHVTYAFHTPTLSILYGKYMILEMVSCCATAWISAWSIMSPYLSFSTVHHLNPRGDLAANSLLCQRSPLLSWVFLELLVLHLVEQEFNSC